MHTKQWYHYFVAHIADRIVTCMLVPGTLVKKDTTIGAIRKDLKQVLLRRYLLSRR